MPAPLLPQLLGQEQRTCLPAILCRPRAQVQLRDGTFDLGTPLPSPIPLFFFLPLAHPKRCPLSIPTRSCGFPCSFLQVSESPKLSHQPIAPAPHLNLPSARLWVPAPRTCPHARRGKVRSGRVHSLAGQRPGFPAGTPGVRGLARRSGSLCGRPGQAVAAPGGERFPLKHMARSASQ